ncbi:Crp/Fnr family transcriptional regulator [Mammaliicoccus sciuri]|uniref:Crp/Fnr family transcriptional regulator n=1 Tax=Mammaliicoccus sciuri TaxID=1296 RepID=UPI0018C90323|nr:Crp/Fnr family transcriptional regulator [Mammaliicoccus sciuri]MBG9211166.1 Crp/Fnr family transcriptional regulator [Mammaliicoccus sciuri]MDT0745967.1 Crp/Fnr family transcriptional regulator [Mammaliicoccus sciuri]MDT0753322.1 Crp/Fnr family transcriptional regulator [Mammaliicoccus sciuri]WQL34133.1 Crp/Fnr family transcriptional regulator [Mammaliicoccus sciuri]WQL61073.1 Crp/Fnr family transcriptional regulator [Mammaliicoccus sciuri]
MTFISLKKYISSNFPKNNHKVNKYLDFNKNEFILINEGILFKYQLYSNGEYNITNIYDNDSLIYLNSDNNGIFTKTDCSFYNVSEKELDSIKDESIRNDINDFFKTELIKKNMFIRDFSRFGKTERVYSILIRLCNSYGVFKNNCIMIDIKLSHTELSQITYMARENVSRTMAKLKKEGIISYENGKIIVHKLDFLMKELQCEDCSIINCSIK